VKAEDARFVWLFVFFDLPAVTKPEKRTAAKFRQLLKDDGFLMLQWSVYVRVCRGEDGSEVHVRRVTSALPVSGSVRALLVTDRQYGRMKLLLGSSGKS